MIHRSGGFFLYNSPVCPLILVFFLHVSVMHLFPGVLFQMVLLYLFHDKHTVLHIGNLLLRGDLLLFFFFFAVNLWFTRIRHIHLGCFIFDWFNLFFRSLIALLVFTF